MPEFTVNPKRKDPYKQFKFRVLWDGQVVPGVVKVTGLTRRTEVITNRTGSDPSGNRKSPGLTWYEPITVERGRSHCVMFEQWVNKVWNFNAWPGSEASLADYRKDILIELYNEADQKVMAFKVFRCWPSDYTALGELDANNGCISFESITLQHEGWIRDYDISEPKEPSYTEPATPAAKQQEAPKADALKPDLKKGAAIKPEKVEATVKKDAKKTG